MKSKIIIIIGLLVLFGGIAFAVYVYMTAFRGAGPAFQRADRPITEVIDEYNDKQADQGTGKEEQPPSSENDTDFPLTLPDGVSIEIFADDVPKARVMRFDPFGRMLVSLTKANEVRQLTIRDGEVVANDVLLDHMNRPHGLATYCGESGQETCYLYVAEQDKLTRFPYTADGTLQKDRGEKIADFPDRATDRHFTRYIQFGPENKLYVSIGSSCDTCYEDDDRYAKIFVMNPDGSEWQEYASGLRNAVFFAFHPVSGEMWATEMGRDHLGDDLPPDEINIVKAGGDYGWPICYGKNIHDAVFDNREYFMDPCSHKQASYIDLPAHVAPLGIAFVREEGWPEDMWYDALVAYHGSWNRSEPVGYEIMRIKLDADGNVLGSEPFISGWLAEDNTSYGRPVDVLLQPGGVMYVSDDAAGVIYKITVRK